MEGCWCVSVCVSVCVCVCCWVGTREMLVGMALTKEVEETAGDGFARGLNELPDERGGSASLQQNVC